VKCPVRDILVSYLAKQQNSKQNPLLNSTALLEVMDAKSDQILKDENGFPTKVRVLEYSFCERSGLREYGGYLREVYDVHCRSS
jgi:hypothetical protein